MESEGDIMYYEDTKIDKNGNIGCFILAGFSLLGLVSFGIKYILGKSNTTELFLVIAILAPAALLWLAIPYINIKNSKRNREIARIIKENGFKVKGFISKFKITHKYEFKKATFFRHKKINLLGGTKSRYEYYDYAVVEYEYKGETKIVNTPYLDFYEKDLISKDVDVFIYEDKVYIDNFQINTEKIERKRKNLRNNHTKVMILFMLIFILIGLSIFLHIIGLIPKKYIAFIIIGLMFLYIVLFIGIEIKHFVEVFDKEDGNHSVKDDEKENFK